MQDTCQVRGRDPCILGAANLNAEWAMPTQKFWVKGLEHADEARVSRAARALDGVLFAAANHSDQCAEVEFEDDRVTVAEIRDALAGLGYSVEVAG